MAQLYKLNLASKPIRNRSIPYLVAGGVVFVILVSIVLSISTKAEVGGLQKLTDSELESFNKELEELEAKGKNIQKQLTPIQRDLLVGSHRLVASKGFGWSRLFADLESMLPRQVSTSRIEVERVSKDQGGTVAVLEVSVLSPNPNLVIEMLDNMRNSGIFRADMRRQERREVDGKVLNEFSLEVVYMPRNAVIADSASASR
jgi:hypothetical protein